MCQFFIELSWRSHKFHFLYLWTLVITSECPQRWPPPSQKDGAPSRSSLIPVCSSHVLFTLSSPALHLPEPLIPFVLMVSDSCWKALKIQAKQRFNSVGGKNHLDIFWLKSYCKNLSHYHSEVLKQPHCHHAEWEVFKCPAWLADISQSHIHKKKHYG